ncbi:MAG: YggT family protein [Acidimicrobiales bacterium]|nr:YggT family protein [Acidimicrobiales bacterium]
MPALICQLLGVYLIVLFAGALLSWFPTQPGSGLAEVRRMIYKVTEPVVAPVRRAIGASFGGIDFSVMIVMFGIIFLQSIIC